MKTDLTTHNAGFPEGPDRGRFQVIQDDSRRGMGASGDMDSERVPWGRYSRALWRYKFLVLIVFALGVGVAYYVADSVPAEFETAAAITVNNVRSRDGGVSPLRTEGNMSALAWMQLIKSPVILDSVVKKLSLNVHYQNVGDSVLFAGLTTNEDLTVGDYTLVTDSARTRFYLRDKAGSTVDSGAVGDSIGRKLGLRWAPNQIHRMGPIAFSLSPLRQVSVGLSEALRIDLPEEGGQMYVKLAGANPKRITMTINQITTDFLAYAEYATRATNVRIRESLELQRRLAEAEYRKAEFDLREFRNETVLNDPKTTATPGGVDATQNIVVMGFVQRRQELRGIEQDLVRLDSIMKAVQSGVLSPSAFLPIPSVIEKGGALTDRVSQYLAEQSKLGDMGNVVTETNPTYMRQSQLVADIRNNRIMPEAKALIAQLRTDVHFLKQRLDSEAVDMRAIPGIQIQDMSYESEKNRRQRTFEMVADKYATAVMAENTTFPDVRLTFPASQPTAANSEKAQRIFAMILIVALAVSAAVAILLDRIDKKFRYPDQATRDLGLTILGVVPRIRKINSWQTDPIVAASVVEAFRTVRLALGNAFQKGEPITLAVTSPGIGDGKSLVASNLALSLAEGGYRTLLIDGDTRRGELHDTFAVERRPGLLDHLAGQAPLGDVVQKTQHTNLWIIPRGTRYRQGPELLMTAASVPMLEELKSRFDAIIIDTPPLSAGVDAFVLGTSVNNMVLVLRADRSDRKLAEAKLDLVDRLPVRVIGAVLNGVNGAPAYQYYKYIDGYSDEVEDETPFIAAPAGRALTTKPR